MDKGHITIKVVPFYNFTREENNILEELMVDEAAMGRWPQYNITGIDDKKASEIKELLSEVLNLIQRPQYSAELNINEEQAEKLHHCLIRVVALFNQENDRGILSEAGARELRERIKKVEGIIRPPKYTFYDMMLAEKFLNEMVYVEDLRYRPNFTSARAVLRKFLYSRYNIKKTDLIMNPDSDKFHTIETISAYDEYKNNDSHEIKIIEESTDNDPSQSICNHLSEYMRAMKDIRDPYMQTGISSLTNKKDPIRKRERFNMPLTTILEFLLMFLYWDGRDFSDSPKRLPRKRHSCSEFSYRLVLQKIKELMNNSEGKPYNRFYKLATEFRCDKLFFHRRLNKLNEYYEYYTGPYFLKTVIYNYDFTYEEILGLKDYIIEEIFNDLDFIISGLQSTLLDFMLPFDILFRFNCGMYRKMTENSFKDFAKILDESKRKAGIIWHSNITIALNCPNFIWDSEITETKNNNGSGKKMPPDNHDTDMTDSSSINYEFSISKNEEYILNILENNTFFNSYFLSENTFLDEFSTEHNDKSNPVWNFTVIKALLSNLENSLP